MKELCPEQGSNAPVLPAEALAARPLLERVARMGDCIGANTVGEIMAISNRAEVWLRENPPGQPVAIEPRGCPTPGACSCVEPVPPAEGEVAELVAALRNVNRWTELAAAQVERAAELLERQQPEPKGPTLDDIYELCEEYEFILADGFSEEESINALWEIARAVLARWGNTTPQPVPISERLPEANVKVLAHYFNALGKGRTVCAIWVPAKTRSDDIDSSDDDFQEYDEESDQFYWPEGWYEAIENWEDLGWVRIYEGEVVYWQPLPKWPPQPRPGGAS